MGFTTCGMHGIGTRGPRCCWRCDRCPKCDGIGRLMRGDYCKECTAWLQAQGYLWDKGSQNYVLPAATLVPYEPMIPLNTPKRREEP